MDLQEVIDSWREYAKTQQETAHLFEDAITAPCPARAVAEAEDRLSSQSVSSRLRSRALIRYRDKMRGHLSQALLSLFRGESVTLRGFHLSYLGSYLQTNVVLALLSEGKKTKEYVEDWALRWELAGIAAVSGRNKFTLLVTGQATQRHFEQYDITIEPDPSALVEIVQPQAVAGSHCGSCAYAEFCDEADRKPPGTRILGAPPPIKAVKKDPRKTGGNALLQASSTLVQRLWRALYTADPERKPGYHPSTIGKEIEKDSPCLRVFYYQAKGARQDPAWSWLEWVFVMGHAWHEVVQELSAEADPLVQIELPVKCGRIVGHQDWRRLNYIIDGKTKSQGKSLSEGNVGQLHTYLYAQLQEENPPDSLAVLTIQKGSGALLPKEVPVDQTMLLRLTQAMTDAEPFVAGDELPPRFEGAGPKETRCRSCYYSERCWKTP